MPFVSEASLNQLCAAAKPTLLKCAMSIVSGLCDEKKFNDPVRLHVAAMFEQEFATRCSYSMENSNNQIRRETQARGTKAENIGARFQLPGWPGQFPASVPSHYPGSIPACIENKTNYAPNSLLTTCFQHAMVMEQWNKSSMELPPWKEFVPSQQEWVNLLLGPKTGHFLLCSSFAILLCGKRPRLNEFVNWLLF